jgi:hypothetical protein
MTIDIVKQLRQEIAGYTDGPIEAAEATMREAADEIELLRKQLAHSVDLGNSFMDEIERLRKVLKCIGEGDQCTVLLVYPTICKRAYEARAALGEDKHDHIPS